MYIYKCVYICIYIYIHIYIYIFTHRYVYIIHIFQPPVHPTPKASPLIPRPEDRFGCGRGRGR